MRTLAERRAMLREMLGDHDVPVVQSWHETADRLDNQRTQETLRSLVGRLDSTRSDFLLLRDYRAVGHVGTVSGAVASMRYWLVFSRFRAASRADLNALELRTAYLEALATLRMGEQDRLVVFGSIAVQLARNGTLAEADLASERACRERPRDAHPLPECVEHALPRETRAGPDGDDPADAAPHTRARTCRDRPAFRRDSPPTRLRGLV